MGWIKTAGLAVILFGICFMAFFSTFEELETSYGSDYNDSDNGLESLKTHGSTEINASNTVILSHKGEIQNGSIASATAEDNLIATGFSIVKEVFLYPVQIFGIADIILGQVFGLSLEDYGWLYTGLEAILMFLIIMAILTVIFKVNF